MSSFHSPFIASLDLPWGPQFSLISFLVPLALDSAQQPGDMHASGSASGHYYSASSVIWDNYVYPSSTVDGASCSMLRGLSLPLIPFPFTKYPATYPKTVNCLFMGHGEYRRWERWSCWGLTGWLNIMIVAMMVNAQRNMLDKLTSLSDRIK